jgi:hypothetical protein
VHFSPTSESSAYDSDFDDESDVEQDDESDDEAKSATSEMQTEVAPEISASEESTVAPTVPAEENLDASSMEGVEDVKEETLSEDDSTGLTSRMAPSWQSESNTSDPSLPGNLSVITDSQISPRVRRATTKTSSTIPGPPKVRIELKDVAYRTYLAMLYYVSKLC